MEELKVFENVCFGNVRGMMIDNKPYVVASDVAKILGYAKPNNAISTHCRSTLKQGIPHPQSKNKLMEVIVIPESDIYRLIFGSKLPDAEKFQDWVFEEVLPQIRQTVSTLETIEFKGNINDLVYSKDGKPMTTSKIISDYTGKEHKHILRDIREEISKLKEIHSPNLGNEINQIIDDFKETTYVAENGQVYTQYELGEMATMQLMLKYSTEYRAKFILSFQKMRQSINAMFKAKLIESVLPQDNRNRQYIYVIKNPLNETVKIGVAQDVEKRIKQLETGAGIQLELIYKSMICSNAFSIERDVHKHFEEYRTFGEWFKINPTTVINFLEQQTFVLKSEFMKYISLIN